MISKLRLLRRECAEHLSRHGALQQANRALKVIRMAAAHRSELGTVALHCTMTLHCRMICCRSFGRFERAAAGMIERPFRCRARRRSARSRRILSVDHHSGGGGRLHRCPP